MAERWFEALRPLCEEACFAARSPYPADVVLFYLARWCQKQSGDSRPELGDWTRAALGDTAEKIARNLAADGNTVERLVAGDVDAWTELRGALVASARPRGGAMAGDYADEALQRVAVVLLTGSSPSHAIEHLAEGPRGPGGEYVFQSPFEPWARQVAKNLLLDELRREARAREPRPPRAGPARPKLDSELLGHAREALPGLLDAIRELPPAQRSVLTLSLARRGVDEMVVQRLRELAPDLFGVAEEDVASDSDIAERLGSTAHRVAANRSAARRKLALRDPHWALLLDALLPHRSTRPVVPTEQGAEARPDG